MRCKLQENYKGINIKHGLIICALELKRLKKGKPKGFPALLACSNLSQSLSLQSTEGGASGINTKSASDAKAVTTARYLYQ